MICQLFAAISHMHSRVDVVHLDLKPENVVVSLTNISTLFFHHFFHKYRASARDGLVFFPYSSPFLLAPRRAMAWWTSFGTRPKTNESLEVADSPGGDHSFHS